MGFLQVHLQDLLSFVILVWTISQLHGPTTADDVSSCSQKISKEKVFLHNVNKELLKASFLKTVARSPIVCVSYCHSESQCQSVNYNTDNRLCELNNATRAQYPDDFVTHFGIVYFGSVHYRGCQELLDAGYTESGIYSVLPTGFNNSLQVYCDMDSDGEGWIVIQRRQDGSEDFYRNWVDYQVGFGSLSGEFWLGNDNLRTLTESAGPWKLKIEMVRWDGKKSFAEYGHFKIDGDNYRLDVGSYKASSTAEDALKYHNGMMFTTKDKDNDKTNGNCAVRYKGAWWYNDCYDSKLNGMYTAYDSGSFDGMYWFVRNTTGEYKLVKECSLKVGLSN